MFEFFTENELISHNQAVFKLGDWSINQLLCITHDIYQSLDDGLETKCALLDISKAFDKIWHEGLLFKLKQNGISGNLLNVVTNFLCQGKQRVVLNEQHLSWANVKSVVFRDLFFDHYSFRSISMTHPVTWLQIQNYLRMTPLCSPLFKI